MNAADRAAALAERWVTAYTRALPAQVAERRRAELRSDLWEQRADAAASPPAMVVALSIVRRLMAGAPADLVWRHQQLGMSRNPTNQELRMRGDSTGGRWWRVMAALLAVFLIMTGVGSGLLILRRDVSTLVGPPDMSTPAAVALVLTTNALWTCGGLLVLAGLVARRRSRLRGDVLIAVGALPSMALAWLLVPALLGLPVIFGAAIDATQARGSGPAARGVVLLLTSALVIVTALTVLARPQYGPLLTAPLVAGVMASAVVRRARSTA